LPGNGRGFTLAGDMNAIAQHPVASFIHGTFPGSQKEDFRLKFQRSMRAAVRRGFTVEEAFGVIWEETWEEISLTEREQCELYEELITWARNVTLPAGCW
jgi:hypothetical protein